MKKEKCKILIIDDDEFLLDIYTTKFKEEDYDVDAAPSGKEALNKLKNGYAPEVILLDIVMPGMDGLEFFETARKENLLGEAKVIMLSNLGQKEYLERALKLGAVDYVVKAYYTPSEVVKKVRSLSNK